MLNEEDFLFGKTALHHGILTKEQLEECILILQAQKEAGRELTLEEVALENHFLTREKLLEIYRLLGKNRIGNYEVEKKIAQGGTSSIYIAHHIQTGKKVALKVLLPHLTRNKEFVARFDREGEALTQFDHPHIVKAYETGVYQKHHFIALELLEGESLYEFLGQKTGIDERVALEIGLQIAKAMKYLHEKGFVHRDIKPQNIMITTDQVVKLIDLGLTKQISQISITQKGMILGTPYYISPEQASGAEKIDYRTDIYSWGATMYHLLTGRPPFVGDKAKEVMDKHLKEDPLPPWQINRSISQKTSALILATLEKEPEDRPLSFEMIIHHVNQILRPDFNTDKKTLEEGEVHSELIYSRESQKLLALTQEENRKRRRKKKKGGKSISQRLLQKKKKIAKSIG
ncbi:MAG: serine/threonine protein kinase, partial [Planctomycetota bacterium]